MRNLLTERCGRTTARVVILERSEESRAQARNIVYRFVTYADRFDRAESGRFTVT